MSQYGVARDQRMADATSVRRNNTEQNLALQLEGFFFVCVTERQAWVGAGFASRRRGGRKNNARSSRNFHGMWEYKTEEGIQATWI